MERLRAFFLRRRSAAMLIVLAALCLKALVPAGFMVEGGATRLTVAICADASGHGLTREIVIPRGSDPAGAAGKAAKEACPWTSLGMASSAGAGAALLALAIAFVLALGFAPVRLPAFMRPGHLSPPLRGPPALI